MTVIQEAQFLGQAIAQLAITANTSDFSWSFVPRTHKKAKDNYHFYGKYIVKPHEELTLSRLTMS